VGEQIRELTRGRGVDIAVEAFGSAATVASALDSVRDGGRVVMAGIAPAGVQAQFEITRVVRRRIQLRGSFGARVRTDMPALISLVEAGHLQPERAISRRFSLAETPDAFDALGMGEIVGRAVVATGNA
jgi:S-(hydroxymethyl)glutathione dehydrogenase/alcohol dehydrogenase